MWNEISHLRKLGLEKWNETIRKRHLKVVLNVSLEIEHSASFITLFLNLIAVIIHKKRFVINLINKN